MMEMLGDLLISIAARRRSVRFPVESDPPRNYTRLPCGFDAFRTFWD